MAFDLGTPVNTALLLYILYAVQRILFPSNALPKTVPHEFKGGYSWMPKAHPPTLLFQTYTPKTLEPFNGEDGKRILLAISGVVYDVTAGRNFYGPRTSFHVLLVLVRLLIVLLACLPCFRGHVCQLRGERCVARDGEAVVRPGCVHAVRRAS